MLKRASLIVTVVSAALAALTSIHAPSTTAQVADKDRAGAAVFENRCMACHSLDANRVGPMLGGVVGRKAGSVPSYDYSDALRRLKGKWDARRLDAWLRDPQQVAPGTKMGFQLQDPQERRQVIMYLGATGARSSAIAK